MLAAPAAPEAKIAIAERAGERDLPDIRYASSAGGAASSAASARATLPA